MVDPSKENPAPEMPREKSGPYEVAPPEEPATRFPAPPLLAGFDEGTDFDEPKLAAPGNVTDGERAPEPSSLVQGGRDDATILSGIAGLLVIGAAVAGAVSAPGSALGAALLAILHAGVYLVAGLGALAITAHLRDRRVGEWGLGAARVFFACAVFGFAVQLRVPALGWGSGFVVVPLALALYLVSIIALFRWSREVWVVFTLSHVTLAMMLRMILSLYAALVSAATDVPAP